MKIINTKHQNNSLITFNKIKSDLNNNKKNYIAHYFFYILREMFAKNLSNWTNLRLNSDKLNSYALRFFFAYGIGFTDRKLRLAILDVGQYFAPSVDASKTTKIDEADVLFFLTKTANWMRNKSKIIQQQKQMIATESTPLCNLTNKNEQCEILTKVKNENLNTLIRRLNNILRMA